MGHPVESLNEVNPKLLALDLHLKIENIGKYLGVQSIVRYHISHFISSSNSALKFWHKLIDRERESKEMWYNATYHNQEKLTSINHCCNHIAILLIYKEISGEYLSEIKRFLKKKKTPPASQFLAPEDCWSP